MKYVLATLSSLVVASCGNGTPEQASSTSAGSHANPSSVSINDWNLDNKHDVISETDTIHLVKILSSTSDDKLRVQIDLTCPTPGIVSAEIKSDAIYVWEQSTGDFIVQGLLRSAGVEADPVSTLVQWRVGKRIRSAHVAQGKYNNEADIPEFITLDPLEPWTGSLAVATETDHGPLAFETPIDTPNALTFLRQCTTKLEKYNVEKAQKDAQEKAAAKVAADDAKERAVLIGKGKTAFIGAVDTFWPKCGEYQVEDLFGAIMQVRTLVAWFKGAVSLTDADRRNGYTWKGKFEASFFEHRGFDREPIPDRRTGATITWQDWGRYPAWPPDCGEIEGEAWLQNGVWKSSPHDSSTCPVKHISCSAIPQ